MAEVRRPPRPAARREQRPPVPQRPAPQRPRSAGVATGSAPRVPTVRAEAESEEVAQPWRRDPARARAARASEQSVPSAVASMGGRLRRGAVRGTGAAADQLGNVTLRLQARLKERAAAQRRLSAIVWARRAGYVAVAALLGWVVLASPVLALDPAQVEVTGYGTVVAADDVAAVVDTHEGQSLATLASSRLADELREVPGVRDASVERVWPRGLLITLESREPVAAVPSADGGYDLLDAEATRVGHAASTPDRLPVVAVPVGEGNQRILDSVLGVVNELPIKLRNRVQDVSATTEDTVTFVLRDGPEVKWGSAEDSALKAKVLQVLLKSAEAKDAVEIDVSAPTLPTVTSA
ncbi:cell division protein FtsQ/DivIB [Demequina iriomotensis]|uniref:cell division protein FtsQ/DivIB n=1 Tax=Demequina iriomotensis TaxID=1536641 RepID=UPI000780F598|nr:cell division protein FtsQ/DivIB [Demequina iriomotensis]